MPASTKSFSAADANCQSMRLSDPALAGLLLQPAARGSLRCPCKGEVVEMRGQYGWLKVHGRVDHPMADMHGGHIFVHNHDIVRGTHLEAGHHVTFYLYADEKGLGAELCRSSCSYAVAAQSGWTWSQQKESAPVQTQAVYCLPYVVVNEVLAPESTSRAPQAHAPAVAGKDLVEMASTKKLNDAPEIVGELPSIGSAGHAEGTCKRCAFFPKGRCLNGASCTHCHFEHTANKRLRKRKPRRAATVEEALPDFQVMPQLSDAMSDVDDDIEIASTQSTESPNSVENLQSKASDCLSEDDALDEATTIGSDGEESCGASSCATPLISERTNASPPASPELASKGCHLQQPSFSERGTSDEIVDLEVGGAALLSLLGLPCESSPLSQPLHSENVSPTGDSALSSSANKERPPKGRESAKAYCEFGPSPNSWLAQVRARRASGGGNGIPLQQFTRMARSLLNKLSHDRFDSLCGQIFALPCSTPEELGVLASEIFDKATLQDGFRALYTDLCKRLDAHLAVQESPVGGKAFRRALANECQSTFETYLQPSDVAAYDGLDDDEKFEAEMKLKARRLGNMRFIGDLIVNGLLAQKLLPRIIYQLLNGDEAALESLIALLMVTAPVFDQDGSIHQAPLLDAFACLQRRRSDKVLSQRLKCHLSDLFDSRDRHWTPRGSC